MENQRVCIEPTWCETTHTYVVGGQTIRKIRAIMNGMGQHMPMDDLVMLNALADWGAKQVTIHRKTDGQHLQKPALTPGKYMVTTPDGDIQRADESHLRKGVAARIRRQLLEKIMAKKPGKYAIKGNTAPLWENESEHMLARSTWPEHLPNFMLQCISGSVRYNADIADEYPEITLYTAILGGKPTKMSMKCPLCVAAGKRRPGEDSRQHLQS
jgi:hypothetical protein